MFAMYATVVIMYMAVTFMHVAMILMCITMSVMRMAMAFVYVAVFWFLFSVKLRFTMGFCKIIPVMSMFNHSSIFQNVGMKFYLSAHFSPCFLFILPETDEELRINTILSVSNNPYYSTLLKLCKGTSLFNLRCYNVKNNSSVF